MSPAPEGQPSHPTKLIVRGADGPLGQRLVDRYSGALKRFHQAQRQNTELAFDNGLAVRRSSVDLGGAQATYSNVYGQETLTLTVHPREVEAEEHRVGEECWETLLVDLILLSGVGAGKPRVVAILNSDKPGRKVAQNVLQDTENFMFASSMIGSGKKVKQTSAAGGADMTVSLRVNLIPLRPGAFTIDVRGYIDPWLEYDRLPREGGEIVGSGTEVRVFRNYSGASNTGVGNGVTYTPSGIENTPLQIGGTSEEYIDEFIRPLFPEETAGAVWTDDIYLGGNGVWLDLQFYWWTHLNPGEPPTGWLQAGPHTPYDPGSWAFLPPAEDDTTYWDEEQQFVRSHTYKGIYRGMYREDPPGSGNVRFTYQADGENTFPDGQSGWLRFMDDRRLYGLTVEYGEPIDVQITTVFVKQGQPFTHYSVAVETVSKEDEQPYDDASFNADRWDSYRWEPQGGRPTLKPHEPLAKLERLPEDWNLSVETDERFGPIICILKVDPCAATVKVLPPPAGQTSPFPDEGGGGIG